MSYAVQFLLANKEEEPTNLYGFDNFPCPRIGEKVEFSIRTNPHMTNKEGIELAKLVRGSDFIVTDIKWRYTVVVNEFPDTKILTAFVTVDYCHE